MLDLIKSVPTHLKEKAIERSIEKFINETKIPCDTIGLHNQTVRTFAQSLVMGDQTIDIWLADKEGEVIGYVIAHICKDIDDSWCYWISQAWAEKGMRANGFTKESWWKLKKRAKQLSCKHIVIVSCRDNDAFNRFLGGKFKEYATLLTMDID